MAAIAVYGGMLGAMALLVLVTIVIVGCWIGREVDG
jgi:hypothetical protein